MSHKQPQRPEARWERGQWPWLIWRKCTPWRCSHSTSSLGLELCPPCSQRHSQALSSLRNLVLLHGFLTISSSAPTPYQSDFSSLPPWPRSPSSPGLSPLPCCGHALDIATTQNGPTPQTGASNIPLQTLTLSQHSCSRSPALCWLFTPLGASTHGPTILTTLDIGL